MISLQFSIINIFLIFRRQKQFHSNSSEIWERKKERKRERVCFERLESHKFIGIFWCGFDLVSQWVGCGGIWEMKFENLFYFRLHYTLQQRRGVLSVCGHFWMEELMWQPKLWDERERWKIVRVCEWSRRREGETVRLTGECVLEEEWMTDICISFGIWNHHLLSCR